MRNATLSLVLLAGCVFCFAIASRGLSAPDGGEFKPVAEVHSLMHGQAIMFKQIRAAIQKKSTPERAEVIEHLSQVLAELANVNTYNNDADDYRQWAKTLRDSALELAEEAEKKTLDEDRMKQLVGEIKSTCGNCHDKYQ